MAVHHDCNCCLTRRQCLQFIGTAALTTGLVGKALEPASGLVKPAAPEDYVPVETLRPKPSVRITMAILQMPRPYWLGWPGTTYDLDRFQTLYRKQAAESAQKLGITLDMVADPIQDEAGYAALVKRVKEQKPDAVQVVLQHMNCWGWADRLSSDAGVPVLIFSPIGTSFTGHVIGISRRPGVYVASTLEWSGVEDGFRMVRAKRLFEESRILWIHGNQRGETVLERLGTKVRQIPRDTFNTYFDTVPVTDEVKSFASDSRKHAKKVVEPTMQDSINSARAYVTAKHLLQEEKANALSMDCLGMVGAKLVPTPPCFAWTRLQDEGITAGCEADLFGAASLMLTSYLLSRPSYMNDPVAETYKNLLVTAHCTCGTRLAGFDKPPVPYILRNHSESALGVSTQVLFPIGEPITLVRFTSPNEIIVDTGKVVSNVNTPPAGGCRTSLELAMDDIEDCRDVLGFHQCVTLGNHKRTVEGFAQLYGMRVVHSPRRAPAATEVGA
jgi:hypothetical protein